MESYVWRAHSIAPLIMEDHKQGYVCKGSSLLLEQPVEESCMKHVQVVQARYPFHTEGLIVSEC